jgi:hypothetical protein
VARSTEIKGASQEYLPRPLLPLRDVAQKGSSVLPVLVTHAKRIGTCLVRLRDCIERLMHSGTTRLACFEEHSVTQLALTIGVPFASANNTLRLGLR